MKISSAMLLVDLLMTEQHRVDPRAHLDPDPALPLIEQRLRVAGAAIAAGTPRRALRELAAADVGISDVDQLVIRDALVSAARLLDFNWFPGDTGAVLGGSTVPLLPAALSPAAVTAQQRAGVDTSTALVEVLCELMGRVFMARSIIADAMESATPDVATTALSHISSIVDRIAPLGFPIALGYVRIIYADLMHRAGMHDEAASMLQATIDNAGADPLTVAHANLVRGDWSGWPQGNALTMGLSIGVSARLTPPADDLSAAVESWRRAADGYHAAGSAGGQASALLRLANASANESTRAERLGAAHAAAEAGGVDVLGRLIGMHRYLARMETGVLADSAEFDDLAGWSSGEGSFSYGIGLCRLLITAAESVRASGDFLAGRAALAAAQRLTDQFGTAPEKGLLNSALAGLFSSGPYRLLGAILGLAEAISLEPQSRAGTSDWLRVENLAMGVARDGNALTEPALLQRGVEILGRLLATYRAGTFSTDPFVGFLGPAVDTAVEAITQFEPLQHFYRARELMESGQRADAIQSLEQLVAMPPDQYNPFMRIGALMLLGRTDEAARIAHAIVASGLDTDLAVDLLLRVHDAAGARDARQRLARDPSFHASADRPWEDLGRQAEIHVGLGEWARGAEFADRAIEAFGGRLTQLGRDVLRTQSTDDRTIAGAELAAIIAHVALAEDAVRAPDTSALAATHLAHALEIADGARSGLIPLATAVAKTGAEPVARQLTAQWLRAGSDWAATVETAAKAVLDDAQPIQPESLRQQVLGAEDALATIEAQIRATNPALLANDGSAARLDVASLIRTVPAGTVMIEYHTFDDGLCVFAVTAHGVTGHRIAQRSLDLAARVAAVHRACSAESGDVDANELAELADLLLGPAREQLAANGRLVVVPHKILSLLPWHLLPWEGSMLGSTHVVSCLPTAALLPLLAHERNRTTSGGLLSSETRPSPPSPDCRPCPAQPPRRTLSPPHCPIACR